MSARNTLKNKKIRRAQREENARIQTKKRLAAKVASIRLVPEPPSKLDIVKSMLWTPDSE